MFIYLKHNLYILNIPWIYKRQNVIIKCHIKQLKIHLKSLNIVLLIYLSNTLFKFFYKMWNYDMHI